MSGVEKIATWVLRSALSLSRDSVAQMALAYRQRYKAWQQLTGSQMDRGRVAVLLTPWVDTAVPFYVVELGFALRRAGHEVVFLSDRTVLPVNKSNRVALQAFELLVRELRTFAKVVDVDCFACAADAPANYRSLAYENAVWFTKGEEMADEFIRSKPDFSEKLAALGGRVTQVLKEVQPSWVLIPGGVFGVAGVYTRVCETLGVDFSTFDSGPGRFFFAHRGIASQSGDLPIAHQRLSEACRHDESLAVHVCEHAAQLGLDRQEMKDASDFQVVKRSYEVKERCDVLVCLNYRADTAALFRCRAFPTVRDWVVQLLEWAKKQGGVRVGIRPHPVTRHSRIKSTDRLEAVVRAVDPDGNFSVWIPPDASVSSYDLIQQAKVVLPFTSTVGIEAVLMDKPIVLGSFCYYDSLGFAHVGATPERYFELVEAGLRGELFPSQEEKKAAALCLYLMMRCRSVHSIFTPQPIDFWKWQAVEPETLWSQEETSDLLESLSMRKPLAWVRHQRAEREWRRIGQCKSSGGSGKGSSFESDGAKPLSE